MTSKVNHLIAALVAAISLTATAEASIMGTTVSRLKGARDGAPGLILGAVNTVLPSTSITPISNGSCLVTAQAIVDGLKTDGTPLDDAYLYLRILKNENGNQSSEGSGLFIWENVARAFTTTIHYVIPVKAGVSTKFGCEIGHVDEQTAGGTAYCYVSYICQ